MTDQAVAELAGCIGVRDGCVAVGASRAGYYRRHRVSPGPERPAPIPHRDRPQPRALSTQEQQAILDVLHSDRFVDMSPAEVWATLLDEGVYLGSQSTFYRLLRQAGEVRERRAQATHPAKVKPELVANGPNQVWSWDRHCHVNRKARQRGRFESRWCVIGSGCTPFTRRCRSWRRPARPRSGRSSRCAIRAR